MSTIVVSGEQISKSPLNTSKSKQMFSFGKADRFEKLNNSGFAKVFYNLPDVKMKRYTTLGRGNKYDFTSDSKGKNPEIYNNKSDFDPKHPYSPMFSFGIGRDKYEKVYCEANKMLDKNVPGPGKYDTLKPFGNGSPKYSIKGVNEKQLIPKQSSPGPGQYPITVQIRPGGKVPVSSIRNTLNVSFGADKSKRFDYNFGKNPGPQHYDIKPLINGKGQVFISKFQSSPGKSMYGRYPDPLSKQSNPGPGSYRTFSEFGIYETNFHQVKHMGIVKLIKLNT